MIVRNARYLEVLRVNIYVIPLVLLFNNFGIKPSLNYFALLFGEHK